MRIKDSRIYTYRPGTYRDVEDWRGEPSDSRKGTGHSLPGPRSAHILFNLSKAKESASLPSACAICAAFDRRCIYCPSSREQWSTDPAAGFTPSAGHIMGNAVCTRHQYGPIPEGIDYVQGLNADLNKPQLEIFVGDASSGVKVFGILYDVWEQSFCLSLVQSFRTISPSDAATYHRALGFALAAMSCLTQSSDGSADSGLRAPFFFQPWP
jgi:hypothetical protein